ncbi:hypothetical protein, partial [Ligilactobacillus salivarius]|uniref:hypothetical protein n=1 Tax=Ligilactobacillus salivarius TaxID=1624 RepID=UPI0024BA3F9F
TIRLPSNSLKIIIKILASVLFDKEPLLSIHIDFKISCYHCYDGPYLKFIYFDGDYFYLLTNSFILIDYKFIIYNNIT